MTINNPILHSHLPIVPWLTPALDRLPGIQPTDNWLVRDEAFTGQMALRDHLIASLPSKVHSQIPSSKDAALECLELTLAELAGDDGYQLEANTIVRPDQVRVTIDYSNPLMTLGRLTQNDFCIMQLGNDGHILAGAILCFPASWTLAEKIGRPLTDIHIPVESYDQRLSERVQRLFDGIRPGQILMRANALRYQSHELFHPRSETDPPDQRRNRHDGKYLRSERQTLRRLPKTGAIIFTIHTYLLEISSLPPEAQRKFITHNSD